MERQDQPGLVDRRPQRFPGIAVVVVDPRRQTGGQGDRVQTDLGRVVHLVDRVLHGQQRQLRGRHEAVGRDALDLRGDPLVLGAAGGPYQLGVLDQGVPEPERGIDHLAPDALAIEVLEPGADVARARWARAQLRDVEPATPLLRGELRELAAEGLAVDVDDLVVAVAFTPRHSLRERCGEDLLEEVLRLEEVRVTRVGPDLHHRSLLVRRQLQGTDADKCRRFPAWTRGLSDYVASTVSRWAGWSLEPFQSGMSSPTLAAGNLSSWTTAQCAWFSSCMVKHACNEL